MCAYNALQSTSSFDILLDLLNTVIAQDNVLIRWCECGCVLAELCTFVGAEKEKMFLLHCHTMNFPFNDGIIENNVIHGSIHCVLLHNSRDNYVFVYTQVCEGLPTTD